MFPRFAWQKCRLVPMATAKDRPKAKATAKAIGVVVVKREKPKRKIPTAVKARRRVIKVTKKPGITVVRVVIHLMHREVAHERPLMAHAASIRETIKG